MPTLDVSKKDFEKLFKEKVSISRLEELLEYVKGELDGQDGDSLKVECKETNRPDLWSTEGLVREILARTGKEKGIKKYVVKKGNIEVFINENLQKVRPLIACAVVKDVKIDDDFIVQMVQLQEKVGETFGRKRRETGIGLYDLDIMTPPVYYKGFKDDEIEFIPLDWKVPMRPSEILSQHEKGKAYKHLLDNSKLFPIVIDSKNVVASMPPIINSQITGKVTNKTKNLFIEVTGFNWTNIEIALEVMCMALADRGGKIFSCKINFPKQNFYPSKSIITPEFKTKKISFDKSLIEKKTGLKLNDSKIKQLLENARYNISIKGNMLSAEFPAYRKDIFHAVDVIEDLLISYGFNNIVPQKIKMSVVGSQRKEVLYADFVRDGCIGLGLQEVLTFNLTSKEIQSEKILLNDEFVEIVNPVSTSYQIMRKRLFPQLLSFLSKNKNQEYPQKIFEIGSCLDLDSNEENGVKQSNNLCVVLTHTNTNFTEIKSVLVSLCDYLGLSLELKKSEFAFLGENSATIIVNGKKGFIGELKIGVAQNFGLNKPVTLFEIEL
ncbi:MAG: phenylalanine--tRNA ligase subunit beta [Candidatus ainarchaeum sp.]|nr:phenylalanine--tRNA ligase subunit beta [Candidatus ainarchaeum sp.]